MQILKALLCQVLAFIAIGLLSDSFSNWGIGFKAAVLIQAAFAASLSSLLAQPVWWRIINLGFMPSVFIMLTLQLPSWSYLTVFFLLTLVFWGTVKGDVPLFLSSSAVADAVSEIVAKENAASFVDIGAGLGTVVVPLALKLPLLRIDAFETAPFPWIILACRCRHLPNVNPQILSFWQCNFADYTVVFAFLSPLVMIRVGEKVWREMKAGSLFISSSFPVPDRLPETIVHLDDSRKTQLYCYRITSINTESNV